MSTLPEGFESLAALADEWALPTEQARYEKRLATPLAQLKPVYDALRPRMDAVMQFLAGLPPDGPEGPARHLFHLALAYFEISHPIELRWRSQDLDDAFPAHRIVYQAPSNAAD